MSKQDDFRSVRLRRGLNRAAQLGLSVTLLLGLNYLASQPSFFHRRDWTVARAHSLAPETLARLRNLGDRGERGSAPIEIFITLPSEDDTQDSASRKVLETINRQMESLLDAFVYESSGGGRPAVSVARADLRRNVKLYTDVAAKIGPAFDPGNTAIVVRCGEMVKDIAVTSLFRKLTNGKGEVVSLDGFLGEEALLSAILEVTDEKRPVLYYTVNHGELASEAVSPMRSSARLFAELKSRRFELRPLNVEQSREIPADASLVLVAGPLANFQPRETEALRRYLRERNGRMLALISPRVRTGLDDLFYDWGVLAQDVLVVENDPTRKAVDGDMIVTNIVLHETTKSLSNLPLYAGALRPVEIDEGRPDDSTLTVSELFNSSQSYSWGERDYLGKPPYSFDFEKGDIRPRPFRENSPVGLPLGVAAERAVRLKGKPQILAGRLVLMGTADIAADARFDKGGNRSFLLNSVNWLVDRDYLVQVPVRPLREFKVNATSEDLRRLALRYSALPAGVAIFGLLVHFWRRRN